MRLKDWKETLVDQEGSEMAKDEKVEVTLQIIRQTSSSPCFLAKFVTRVKKSVGKWKSMLVCRAEPWE